MQEFGKTFYKNIVYINFDNNQQMKELFSTGGKIDRIVMGLELYVGHKIETDNTLLIFDEIQEVPQALSALKYFNETAPQYQIVCAGSLLGVALHQGTSFPVGKVEFLDLYPLSFSEFVRAIGKEAFVGLIENSDFDMMTTFKQDYIDLLKQYTLQQLKTLKEVDSYYWTNDRGSAEIDFLIDTGKEVIPMEVKAEANLKAKSLKIFCEKFKPKTAIRLAMVNYKQEEWLLNLPLWAVETIR